MNCPFCDGPSSRTITTKKRSFFVCDSCGFIWADPKQYLNQEAELGRYMLHDNSRENEGYVAFITSILEHTLHRWEVLRHIDDPTAGATACTPLVLDWGAGPEPLASELLRERGFTVQSYDPLFGPPLPLERQRFDIILCIEVAEHFKNPIVEFETMARYLKPGGLLSVHTHTIPMELFASKEGMLANYFVPWWYKEDLTHVSFYSEKSLRALGFVSGLRYEPPLETALETLHFFEKPLPVLVVGGANIDIEGRPLGYLKDRDSNPGQVRFSRGGAGRNVAENLAKLGLPVQLVSVFSKDPLSRILLEETKAAGVGVDGVLFAEGAPPSSYLSILDETGDMRLAISSMESITLLTPKVLHSCLSALVFEDSNPDRVFSGIIVDGNLLPETIEALLDKFTGIPSWFDPVSTSKAQRFAAYREGSLLKRLYGLKPNRDELFAMVETLHWDEDGERLSDVEPLIEMSHQKGLESKDVAGLAKILLAARFC